MARVLIPFSDFASGQRAVRRLLQESRDARQPEDTQRIYAHAYAARLAKQVVEELESSRRKAARPKKLDGR